MTRRLSIASVQILLVSLLGCGTKDPSPNPGNPVSRGPLVPVAEGTKPQKTQPSSAGSNALLEKVSQRLLATMEPLPHFVRQPTFEIADQNEINAYATASIEGQGKDVTIFPKVVIYSGLMNRVVNSGDDDGAEDRLAFVVSHELAHVLLAHVVRRAPGDTAFVQQSFTREQESQADLKGMEMALKAGYSFKKGQSAIARMKDLGLNYSSFEGLGADHPSWNDRLSLMDKEQSALWKSMSAFQNGLFFLLFEQYAAAERCFEQVTREFPECYEAWSNLGYALLMQYCDGLEPTDLRQLGIGQMVVGGFYTRPKSLDTLVRGQDEKLWKAAVHALEQSLKIKPDLTLAKANLGVAYLVAPQGKDVAKARQYFQRAIDGMSDDRGLTPLANAAILINAGVADIAAGESNKCAAKFTKAEQAARESANDLPRAPATFALFTALCYNRGLLLAASPDETRRGDALPELERYLSTVSPASAWSILAYERYVKLCSELGVKAKDRKDFQGPTQAILRMAASVKVKPGLEVALSEPVSEVTKRLGAGQRIPVVRGTKLVRLSYPDHGMELLVADRVLAIQLSGDKAPALPLRGIGLSSGTQSLRVGMSEQELDDAIRNQPFENRVLDKPGVEYRFYPHVGLGVRFHAGKVQEILVAQVPRRANEDAKGE